jgi:HD superfamily phosphohydrolase
MLAEKVVKNLRDHQPELNITPNDLLCVTVAGLCHDLGHGPFSHIFDGMFIKRIHPNGIILPDKSVKRWRHEDGSVAMFQYLLEANHIDLSEFGLDKVSWYSGLIYYMRYL